MYSHDDYSTAITHATHTGNNKKLIESPDGTWLCEATQKSYPAPEYRYILPVCIMDASGQTWVTMFNDQAKTFLGKSADDMFALNDSNTNAYEKECKSHCWRDVEMRLRIQADTYNEEKRLRVVCSTVKKINYAADSKFLLSEIQDML